MTHLCAYPLYNLMQCLAVVTLHTFYLGKLDLWTVYLGKLDFLSVTDFPEVTYLNLFYRLRFGYISRKIVSLDSYPKALAGEIGRIQMECLATQANVKS